MVSHIYILHFSDRIIYVSVHNSMYNLCQDYFNILKMHRIYIIINRCYESSNRLFTYYSFGIFRVRFSAIVRFNVITICVKVSLLFRKLMYFPC